MENKQSVPEEKPKDIRLQEPTFIDPLTGLFNQYYLYQFLPEELKKAKLANYPLAVLMIDLDGFKAINDTYGHLCGDEVLRQFSAILKNLVRKTDMVIRYAGDEFTVLLPTADPKTAETLSRRFIQDVAQNVFQGKEGQELHITISVGFAIYPSDAEQIDKLIDLADKALYLSKQKGKNRVSQAKDVSLEAVSYQIAMDSFPCLKFIDRQDQIARLKHICETVVIKSNLLQAVFISGDTGTGKTRLLSEFSNYIQDRVALINCRCTPAHTQDPYYLFAQGISSYIDKIGPDNPQVYSLLSRLSHPELMELSLLIRPLSNIVNRPLSQEVASKQARFLLFKGFLDFLIELNKAQTVLIYFDDIYWADQASLKLIHYLIKQEKNKRIFIVCSFSEDKSKEVTKEKKSDFKDFLEDVSLADNFTQLKLTNFLKEETRLMIQAIFPNLDAGEEFYALIHHTTDGNPSFIEELLKSLVENGLLLYQDNHWQIKKEISQQDFPSSLKEVVKNRLKNLDAETKEMIIQAAVIGEDFSLDLLKKIGNKDEGFTLELLNRAKKMRLVDELETRGRFGFLNKNIQDQLYAELEEEKRNQLHYKIGQVLAERHKDNLYDVAGELAFHFSKAPKTSDAQAYNKIISEKINRIFNSGEVLEYLDGLAKEVGLEEERPAAILSDKMLKEALKFVRSLQGAAKNYALYPSGTMRSNIIKETLLILNSIWQESERLNIGEVEKGLVINGTRIPPKEISQASLEYFLALMMDQNLKTISFFKGISPDELNSFVQNLISSPEYIKDQGGWVSLIEKEGIKAIKIDEVHFVQVGKAKEEFEKKRKIEDIMLMEFLLGKVEDGGREREAIVHNMLKEPKRFARNIMEATQTAIKEGKAADETKAVADIIKKIDAEILSKEPRAADFTRDLAGVILELEPALRNRFIRSQFQKGGAREKEVMENIIKVIPDEVIVAMVMEEYKESQANLLVTKDTLDNLLTEEKRRESILPKIEEKLLKVNASKEDIAFIKDEVRWEGLSLEKRIETIVKLPDKYFVGQIENIKLLLYDLDSGQHKQELENILLSLIVKAAQLEPRVREALMSTLIDFIIRPLAEDKTDVMRMEDRLDGLLKRLDIEVEPKIFAGLLEIFRTVTQRFSLQLYPSRNILLDVETPKIKGYCLFIYRVLKILSKRLKEEKNRNTEIYSLILDFIKNVYYGDFLEALVYIIVNRVYPEKIELKEIFPLIQDRFIDTFINLQTHKVIMLGDSFQEYVIRKGVADLLLELGEPALNILKERLLKMEEDIPIPLIELLGYLKKEEMIDVLSSLLSHKDIFVRRSAIIALSDIGTKKAIEIISLAANEERDKRLRLLAKEHLKRLQAGE